MRIPKRSFFIDMYVITKMMSYKQIVWKQKVDIWQADKTNTDRQEEHLDDNDAIKHPQQRGLYHEQYYQQ